jgi:amino acid adenylation domain-containing protein
MIAAEKKEPMSRDAQLERVWTLVEGVLPAYGLGPVKIRLLEQKKNVTFRLEELSADGSEPTPGSEPVRYVMRVCEIGEGGYDEAEIRSELQFLRALRQATGLMVPDPVPARDGSLVVRGEVEGISPRYCAIFRWVPGRMVEDSPTPELLEKVGELAARIHKFSETFEPPADFSRPRWDAARLFGEGRVLAPGQGEPLVSGRAREMLEEAVQVIREEMNALGEGRDVFGLIHKDLEPDNTLVHNGQVHAIDFADLGWGHYLYDIAASLLPLREKQGFPTMRDAFLRGYNRVRPLRVEHEALVETFLIARSIFSVRLMTGKLWDLPQIREYTNTAVPQILGGVRVFLEQRARARKGSGGESSTTRTTVQFLTHVRAIGVKVWAEGEKLRFSAPQGTMTPELMSELKDRKFELLSFLRQGHVAKRSSAPTRLTNASEGGDFPLSFAQQRLWFIDQLFPGSVQYNIARAVRLKGRVELGLLGRSLNEVVQRHAALRTTFTESNGQPVQRIAAHLDFPLPVVDLRGLPAGEREEEAWRLAREDARRPFDLERGPVLRVFILQLDDTDFMAPSTMHHIVGDGWSSGILFREMGALYTAFVEGKPSPLPELPIQYADFSVWQRGWLQGEVLDEQIGYWKQQLEGAPRLLELPTDHPRSAMRSVEGDRRSLLVPAPLMEELRAFAQAQGATLFMILLAAFKGLLSRYAGQEDIVVGSPIANRNRTETEGLIGFFTNTLVLRTQTPWDDSFRHLLAGVRKTTLEAYAHQDLPFEKIVEELHPERGVSDTPFFQVVFTLQNVPYPDMQVSDFRMTLMPPTGSAAQFDLTCNMKEMPEGIRTSFMYKLDLFDPATIARFAAHYLRMLEVVAADPNLRLWEIPLLAIAEQQQLLREWNPVVSYPEQPCLHDLFAARVAERPDAVAVSYEDQSLTYGDLEARANRLAHRLRALGVGPEVPVGLCVERSLDMVIGILGILKAGGAYVPLDPAYPKERLAFALADARPPVMVTQERLRDGLPESSAAVVCLDAVSEGLERESAAPPAAGTGPESLAYVIYTSGSTGRPKGSLLTHRNVTRLFACTEDWYRFGASDVWTLFHSYDFDFSVWELWGALLYGGRLVVVPHGISRSPADFHALLCHEGVTVLNQTPSAFRQLVRVEEEGRGDAGALRLRTVIFGGEALDLSSLEPWFARHGDHRSLLVNMYGITETTVHASYRPVVREDLRKAHRSPIGVPIRDLRIHILDRKRSLVPVGVPGEIHVGGPGLGRGYLGRPELTAERFVPDPFAGPGLAGREAGGRLYRTGDLARYLPDGDIEYLGRIDHQVKIRGFRIELGEIEATLARCAGVREALVLAREVAAGDHRLVAYFVPAGEAPAAAELREALRQSLPDSMVPQAFVPLAVMPLSPSGKIDFKALPEPTDEQRAAEGEL